jgi:hypothetical protein
LLSDQSALVSKTPPPAKTQRDKRLADALRRNIGRRKAAQPPADKKKD